MFLVKIFYDSGAMIKITHTHVVVSLAVAIVIAGGITLVVYQHDTSQTVPQVISGTVNELTQVAKGNFATSTPGTAVEHFSDITAVTISSGDAARGVASTTFSVGLAMSEAERAQGLSGRTSLAKNTGLLFVFESPDKHGFWMKDMNFPIDIVWIDEHMKIIHIESNVSPHTYPKTFFPPSPDRFVLETPAGSMKSHKISEGDTVTFVYKIEQD